MIKSPQSRARFSEYAPCRPSCTVMTVSGTITRHAGFLIFAARSASVKLLQVPA